MKCPDCEKRGIPKDTQLCPNCGYDFIKNIRKDILPEPVEFEIPSLIGWTCPVCGMGNSPFSLTCPCKQPISIVYSAGDNSNIGITNTY